MADRAADVLTRASSTSTNSAARSTPAGATRAVRTPPPRSSLAVSALSAIEATSIRRSRRSRSGSDATSGGVGDREKAPVRVDPQAIVHVEDPSACATQRWLRGDPRGSTLRPASARRSDQRLRTLVDILNVELGLLAETRQGSRWRRPESSPAALRPSRDQREGTAWRMFVEDDLLRDLVELHVAAGRQEREALLDLLAGGRRDCHPAGRGSGGRNGTPFGDGPRNREPCTAACRGSCAVLVRAAGGTAWDCRSGAAGAAYRRQARQRLR